MKLLQTAFCVVAPTFPSQYSLRPKTANYFKSKYLGLFDSRNQQQWEALEQELSIHSQHDDESNLAMMVQQQTTNDSLLINNGESSPQQQQPLGTFALLTLALLSFSIFVTSMAMGELLLRFEWFQGWRYLWPLLGILYANNGIQFLRNNNNNVQQIMQLPSWRNTVASFSTTNTKEIVSILEIIGGIGLVIGGAYDAFMPVWMTGPNVFTNAGIGQDAAVLLFLSTFLRTYNQILNQYLMPGIAKDTAQQKDTGSLLFGVSQVFLLAQLYKLGEGSFDEIITQIQTLLHTTAQ